MTAEVATTLCDNCRPTAAKPGTLPLLGVAVETEAACRGRSSGGGAGLW